MIHKTYDHYYDFTGDEFSDIEEAYQALLDNPLTHENPYLIGDDERILAIVFQNRVYLLVPVGALSARTQAAMRQWEQPG